MTEKEFGASKLALNIRSVLFTTAGMAALHTPLTFAEEAEEGAEEKGEKIVVVGSRIRRDDYASAQPIEIISAEDAISQGVDTVGELL